MDEPATRTTLEKGLVSSLVLIGLTALSYALAYRYEQGFLSHFGAPKELITIDLTRFVWVAAALLFLTFSSYIAVTAGAFILMKAPSSYFRLVGATAMSAGVVTGIFWIIGAPIPVTAVVTSVVIFFMFVTLRREALRSKTTFAFSVWEDALDLLSKPNREGNPAVLFWLILMTIGFTSSLGSATAKRMQTFYVRSGTTEQVLVRTYGNSSLWAEFDRENSVIRQSFMVIPMDRDTVSFRRERLGRLTVADPYEAE